MPSEAISSAASTKNPTTTESRRWKEREFAITSCIVRNEKIGCDGSITRRERRMEEMRTASGRSERTIRRRKTAQHEDFGPGRDTQPLIPDVAYNADDLKARSVRPANASHSPDGVRSRPVTPGGRFVNHDGNHLFVHVVIVQQAAIA
jgi:hypothetical protein